MPSHVPDPELRQIIGALVLGADHPIAPREIRRVLEAVALERRAETGDGPPVTEEELLAAAAAAEKAASEPTPPDSAPEDDTVAGTTGIDGRAIKQAFADLQQQLRAADLGIDIVEVSGGFRLQTSADCGPWVRRMLNRGKPHRISRPMIETLAIIAYRQPISRSEIESIRGVSVGHVVKALMEMQLVRIVGRSDLPGRPFLFGTTATFLDHFGLKSLNDLNAMQPGVERTPPAEQRAKHIKHRPKPADDKSGGATPAAPAEAPAAAPASAPEPDAPDPIPDLFTVSADVPPGES